MTLTHESMAKVPEEARELIERHAAWLGGWEALDRRESITMHGTVSTAGLTGTIVVRARRDGYRLTEVDLGVYRSTEGVTPEDAWERNTSGQVESIGPRSAEERRFELRRSFAFHLRGTSVTVLDPLAVTVASREWSAVGFYEGGANRYELLIDPRTGESIWEREIKDRETTWHESADWRVVDGIRVAHCQVSRAEAAEAQTRVQWDGIVFNQPLDLSLFARPTGSGLRTRFHAGTPTPWFPIRLHGGRFVMLEAKVNGHAVEVVLDSGAGMTVLDAKEADRLGLTSAGAIPTVGVGGRAEAAVAEGVELEIGQVSVGPLTVVVMDLSSLALQLGIPLRGILGKEIFHATVVELDYPAARLRLHERDSFTYAGPGRRVDLHPTEGGHQEVDVEIEELAPARVQLDTGSGDTISLFQAFVERNALLAKRDLVSNSMSHGVGGGTTSRLATLRSVTFAGLTMPDVPASFHDTAVGAFATSTQAGNLGAGILSRFCVVFDYGHGCLWIEPRPGWDSAPFAKNRSGLKTSPDGEGLEILHVASGSPGEQLGFAVGERIVAIDGRRIGPDYFEDLWRWNQGREGTPVELEMSDGSRRVVILKTYY